MGKTGNGKTTTILKFLGNNFKRISYNQYVPASSLSEKHQSFFTSAEATSCTRYINAA